MQDHTAICVRAIALLGSHITATQTLEGEAGSITFSISARVLAIQLPAADSGVEVALLVRHDEELEPCFCDEFLTLSTLTLLTVNGVVFADSPPVISARPRQRLPISTILGRGALRAPLRGGRGSDTAGTRERPGRGARG